MGAAVGLPESSPSEHADARSRNVPLRGRNESSEDTTPANPLTVPSIVNNDYTARPAQYGTHGSSMPDYTQRPSYGSVPHDVEPGTGYGGARHEQHIPGVGTGVPRTPYRGAVLQQPSTQGLAPQVAYPEYEYPGADYSTLYARATQRQSAQGIQAPRVLQETQRARESGQIGNADPILDYTTGTRRSAGTTGLPVNHITSGPVSSSYATTQERQNQQEAVSKEELDLRFAGFSTSVQEQLDVVKVMNKTSFDSISDQLTKQFGEVMQTINNQNEAIARITARLNAQHDVITRGKAPVFST